MSKKTLYILLLILSLIIIVLGLLLILNVFKDKNKEDDKSEFLATTGIIVQVGEGIILVEEKITKSLFQVSVIVNNYTVGDEVKVYTKDPIRESYPAQVTSSKIEITYNISNKPNWYYEITYDNFKNELNMSVNDNGSIIDGSTEYSYGQYLYLINEILKGSEEKDTNEFTQDNVQYSFLGTTNKETGVTKEVRLIYYNSKSYISIDIPYISSNTYKISNLNKLEQLLILNY